MSSDNNYVIDMSSVEYGTTCGAKRENAYTPESYAEEMNIRRPSKLPRSYHYEHEYFMLQERVQGLERENARLMEHLRKDEEIRKILGQVHRLLNNANLYRANDLLSTFMDVSNEDNDILHEPIRPVFQRQTNHPPVNALIPPMNRFTEMEEGNMSMSSSSDDDSMPSLISANSQDCDREQLSNPLDEPHWSVPHWSEPHWST
jgi:hypothetical protein